MSQTIHHESFAYNLFHYKDLVCLIHHILSNGGGTESYICKYRLIEKYMFFQSHTNRSYHCHPVLCHQTKTTPHRNKTRPSRYSLSTSGRIHFPKDPRWKQHHNDENGTVVQIKVSHVYSQPNWAYLKRAGSKNNQTYPLPKNFFHKNIRYCIILM